jgi:hypothetical protein
MTLLQVQADEIRVPRRSAGSTGWPLRWSSEADCGSAGPLARRTRAGVYKQGTLENVGCGWSAVATTCYGGTALWEKSAPRR